MSGLRVTGCQELVQKLEKIGGDSRKVAQDCVKEGIGVVTDEMRASIQALKVSEQAGKKEKIRYCRQWEKDAMLKELGYTPNREIGTKEDRKAGFDGYVTSPTGKKVAVRAIANSINAGTSFMKKQPIFQPVIRSSREKAISEMQRKLTEELRKYGLDASGK